MADKLASRYGQTETVTVRCLVCGVSEDVQCELRVAPTERPYVAHAVLHATKGWGGQPGKPLCPLHVGSQAAPDMSIAETTDLPDTMPPGLYAVGVELPLGWTVVAWSAWQPWAEKIAVDFAKAYNATADILRSGVPVASVSPTGELRRVARCGQQSVHGRHPVDHGPDQPRDCPGYDPRTTKFWFQAGRG